jgi:hypothetical protein
MSIGSADERSSRNAQPYAVRVQIQTSGASVGDFYKKTMKGAGSQQVLAKHMGMNRRIDFDSSGFPFSRHTLANSSKIWTIKRGACP